MNHQKSNYDDIRCPCCGIPWPEHEENDTCSRYRPFVSPPWVAKSLARHELAESASDLARAADEAEVARRELVGGVPTREWRNGRPTTGGPGGRG
jgi:hypothetical protein